MASIIINEIDKTIYNTYENTSDNIVYVVGSAIKGSTKPTLCTTYDAFIKEFGNREPIPEDASFCTSWGYAVNLLIAGFPILFRRCVDSDTQTKASFTFSYTTTEEEEETTTEYLKVNCSEDCYGSYYNGYKIEFVKTPNGEIVANLYDGNLKIDSKKVCNIADDDTTTVANFNSAIGDGFVMKNVAITKLVDIESIDVLNSFCGTEFSFVGGTDLSDGNELATYINNHSEVWSEISDNVLYDVKFITMGGNSFVPSNSETINTYNNMVELATSRKDCIAILDVPFSTSESEVGNYFNNQTTVSVNSSYATAFAPYSYFQLNIGGEKIVAPSFVFLYTLATSLLSGNSIFNPPAGVRRGAVPNINKTCFEVGSTMLNQWQDVNPQSINPIIFLRNYGYVIFGQRTLLVDGEGSTKRSALKELSVRLVANEIKRMIRNIAIGLTFEANTLRTWNEFKGQLDPYLAQILAINGIEDYQIIMDSSTTTVDDINNNTIRGIVKIVVSRSAENFVIDFEMSSNGTVFGSDVVE